MNKESKIIFISWSSHHSHTQQLGDALGANIYYVNNLINSRGLIWRLFFLIDYISKGFRTLIIILKENPEVVFVQNPPSFAIIVVVLISFIKRIKVVSDTHNGAFEEPWFSVPLHKWALKKANLVIVHNQQLFNELKNKADLKSVHFKVLNSRITDFSSVKKEIQPEKYFLIISTFHGDEPMDRLLEGIRLFNSEYEGNIKFKVTGNYKKKPLLYSEYSKDKNIEFLGFVDQIKYNYLLVNAFGVISLSTRDKVQQFSLMEAIGAEVPFISTDNMTNKALFGEKMILTKNEPTCISKSIIKFLKINDILSNDVKLIKRELSDKWKSDFKSIKSLLNL